MRRARTPPLHVDAGAAAWQNQGVTVSVVVATRNRPVWLRRAMQSVLRQTHTDLQLVVVDENDPGSPGRSETAAVVADLFDGRVSYLADRAPTWVCRARNEGVAASRGEVVAFLDDDDWWHPTKLEHQVELFASGNPQPALVYTGLEVVDGEGTVLKHRRAHLAGDILPELLRENVIGTPSSVAMLRTVFDELGGFDPAFPTRHDLDLYIRVAERYPIECVPEPLTVYLNLQADAMSKHFSNKMTGREMIYRKHERHYRDNPTLQAQYHYGTALLCLKHGRPAEARTWLGRSLSARPNSRALTRWALSWTAPARGRFDGEGGSQ